MTTLKQGDLVKDHRENTRKVLGVCGEVVHLSFSDRQDAFANSYTEVTLRESGYTWDTPAWEPVSDLRRSRNSSLTRCTLLARSDCRYVYWLN